MKAVIQVVDNAEVEVNNQTVASINEGLLIYVGIHKNDTGDKIEKLSQKLVNLRVFDNTEGKMDLSLLQKENLKILIVSQFTLYADTSSRRPGFSDAMTADDARLMFERLVKRLKELAPERIESGVFQAHMMVRSTNKGPFTLVVEV